MADNNLPILTEGSKPTIQSIYDQVDRIVQTAIDAHDVEIAFRAGQTLDQAQRLAGMGLARLLFKMKINWNAFQIDVPFEDVAYQYLELKKENINRYVRVVEMLESGDVPEEIKEKLEQKPIRELIPIATTSVAYDIPPEKWTEIAEAPNLGTVQETLREIKNEPPRKNSLLIRLTRDGSLRVYPGGYLVGFLQMDSEEEGVQKAIQRILSGAGVLQE